MINIYKITGILPTLSLVNRVAKPIFYCTGKHIEKWLRERSRNAEENANEKNFPNLDVMSVFGLETEGDNQKQNKTKSKTTKGNNSAEGEGSTKKRRFAVVETRDILTRSLKITGKKNKAGNTMGRFSIYRSVSIAF